MSCSNTFRRWEFDQVNSCYRSQRSRRIFLPPETEYSGLSLEVVRTASDTRMYLNTYSLPLSAVSDNANKIELTLSTENGSCPVFVDSLEGGQRLILPSDVATDVICHLLEGKPVTLSIGRYQSKIIPNNFASVYHRLRS